MSYITPSLLLIYCYNTMYFTRVYNMTTRDEHGSRAYYFLFPVRRVLSADRTPLDDKSTANFAPQRDNYTPVGAENILLLLLYYNI